MLPEKTIATPFLTLGDRVLNLTNTYAKESNLFRLFSTQCFLIRYRFDNFKKNLVLTCFLVEGQEDDTRTFFFEISQKLVVKPPMFHNLFITIIIGGAVGIEEFRDRLFLSAEKCL